MESPFYRGLKKIKKNFYSQNTVNVEGDIKELLYKNLNVSDSICDDLYFRYCGDSENIFDSAFLLSDVVDLFNGEYDEVNDPLKEADWIYVRNVVNSCADEMDLDIVTYIMRLIVDRGLY
jgi:hypothetical protein